jgi:hypothetical protein
MSDFTAVPLEARAFPARRASTRIGEARLFVSGLLFTAMVALVGTFLVTVALVIGVVGSPVIAAVVAYVALRQRRAARERAWAA